MHELAPLAKFVGEDYPFLKDGLDDIGLVIQATSLIDKFLRLILISGFRSETVSKTLLATIFEGNGPLSTFSGRIAVCTALGLTSPQVRHDLAIIKAIRNEFAHSPVPLSLDAYPQVKSLTVSVRRLKITDTNEFRLKFKHSCAGIISFLGQFALLAIARDRFVSKNKEGVLQELREMEREIGATQPDQ